MKIIGFAGSPRVKGNSDLLLDEVLKGAQEAGAEVEKVYLNKLDIAPCQACEACRKHDASSCAINDDMQRLYRKLLDADAWVLATPVYWWGPSAQLKLMVDRWYALMPKREHLVGKKAALVVTMADSDLKTARPTIEMFEDAFYYLKMKLLKPVVVTASKKGEVAQNKTALNQARDLGQSLVE